MTRLVFATLLILATLEVNAAELVQVPAGQIEAIWLTPTGAKDEAEKNKTSKIFVKAGPLQAMALPVTVGQFKNFIKNYPKWSRKQVSSLFADEHYLTDLDKTPLDRPVTYVSWFAARAYCESLGMRLPTVNEWEYMAAASDKAADANRDPHFLKRILEWYGEPKGAGLKKVGSIYKNKYGLWDMHGLIWEWVEDFNSSFVTGESREDGSLNRNLFCGDGGISSGDKENYAAFMRFAFRSGLKGKSAVWNLGFRCVKE